MSMYRSLFTVAIPVNSSKFQELFEDTIYIYIYIYIYLSAKGQYFEDAYF
jgi:hypothetical protein